MSIESILDSVPSGTTLRSDCPVCGGENSFIATNVDGKEKKYLCFKASCSVKGRRNAGIRDLDSIKSITLKRSGPPPRPPYFRTPVHFMNATANQVPLEFLGKYDRLVDVVDGHEIQTAIDLYQNRLVFFVEDERGDTVDAIGKWMGTGYPGPVKWYRYANSGLPYLTPRCNTPLILVEDCISAALVFNAGFSGGALMGTSLNRDHIMALSRQYDEIIVALDADAIRKSVYVMKELAVFCRKVTAKRIGMDLKDMSFAQLEDTLAHWTGVSNTQDREDSIKWSAPLPSY